MTSYGMPTHGKTCTGNWQKSVSVFEKKGSGAVIFVGDIAVKASSVDRAFSMKKLCRKWGEFTEGNYTEEKEALPPEPVSSVNLEEWKLYQQEFEEEEKETRNDEEITPVDSLRQQQREQRRKGLARLAQYGVPVLNIARHYLKIQQREERRFLRGAGKKARRHKPRFEAWLRQKDCIVRQDFGGIVPPGKRQDTHPAAGAGQRKRVHAGNGEFQALCRSRRSRQVSSDLHRHGDKRE